MKNFSKVSLVVVTLSAGLLAGCALLDKAYKPEVTPGNPASFETNIVYQTNLVVVQHTNENGINLPTFEHQVVPVATNLVPVPPIPSITNLAPNPTVLSGFDLLGGLPFPFAGTAAVILGWAYSAYAAVRNKKVNVALVQSVEAGRKFLQETPEGQKLDAKFTATLESHQDAAGVLKEVNSLLSKYVG